MCGFYFDAASAVTAVCLGKVVKPRPHTRQTDVVCDAAWLLDLKRSKGLYQGAAFSRAVQKLSKFGFRPPQKTRTADNLEFVVVVSSTDIESAREEVLEDQRFTLRQRIALWFITWGGYLLIRCLCPTLRFIVIREPGCLTPDGLASPAGIWCFWHRAVIAAGYRFRDRQMAVMVSRSFDGEYIARILTKLGFRVVRGSSSRGAVGALLGMRRELEAGHPVAFTIDGPRGPRYVAKPGPVLLAQKTGETVSCFYIAVERAWVVNSWDRMVIPKPFSRACAYFSNPMAVPAGATDDQMAALRQQMQATLERCRTKAEEAVGIRKSP